MIAPDGHSRRVVRFGVFEADLDARELRKHGLRVKLQDQPFQVLALLLEHPGEIVTREELQKAVWPEDTFVEFDHGLNTAVQKIRAALGDDASNPRFVETVPRRGYRFVAPVQITEDAAPTPRPAPPSPRWRLWLLGAATAISVIVIAAYAVRRGPPPVDFRLEQIVQRPLTRYQGDERAPTFSPDGSQVAFFWAQEPNRNPDIWVVVPGTASPRQITRHPDAEISPVWAPDGASLAFLRQANDSTRLEVWSASALGGAERKLGEIDWPRPIDHVLPFGSLLSWSPDGRWLALSSRSDAEGPLRLLLLSPDTLETRWLTAPEQNLVGDLMPSFSPDGAAITFVRRTGVASGHELLILPLTAGYEPAGQSEKIAPSMLSVFSPVWTPDGNSILYLGQRLGQEGVWAVRPWAGEEPRLVWPEREARSLAIGPAPQKSGFALALDSADENTDIWSLSIRGADAGKSRPIVATTRREGAARFSPRGDKIAYSSDGDVWICDRDGGRRNRLTRLGALLVGWPSWSPDGNSVVFHCRLEGDADIYVADVESGTVRVVAPHAADDAVPVFSPDGGSIYFSSRREGDWAVWRVPFQGGEAVRVTDPASGRPHLSPTGRFLYSYRFQSGEIWRRALSDGVPADPEEAVIQLQSEIERVYFPVEDGLYFVQSGVLRFLDFEQRETQDLFELEGAATGLSPDGTTLLYMKRSGRGRDLLMLTSKGLP